MTGIFVRVKRNNKWINEEIEYLDCIELEQFLATKNEDWKNNLIQILCATIADCEQELKEDEKALRIAYSMLKDRE